MQVENIDISKALGMIDTSKLRGRVRIKVLDKAKNVLEDKTVANNIVLGIRKPIISLLAGYMTDNAELPFITTLKLGSADTNTDGSGVKVTDTDLFAFIPGSTKNTQLAPVISEDGLQVTFAFLYAAGDTAVSYDPETNPVTIKEMGLFTRDDQMVAHTTVGEWRKSSGVYFEIYWTIGYSTEA